MITSGDSFSKMSRSAFQKWAVYFLVLPWAVSADQGEKKFSGNKIFAGRTQIYVKASTTAAKSHIIYWPPIKRKSCHGPERVNRAKGCRGRSIYSAEEMWQMLNQRQKLCVKAVSWLKFLYAPEKFCRLQELIFHPYVGAV